MTSPQEKLKKDDDFVRTVLIAVICLPLIGWLVYHAYEKSQQSGAQTSACQQQCTAQGHPGYDFQWPMFGPPKCTCLDARQ